MGDFVINIQCKPEDLVRATLDVHMALEAVMDWVTLPKGLHSECEDWTWTLDYRTDHE
jgi:hypothetical protein